MLEQQANYGREVDVCILMATFNGEYFLKKQLDSFAAQTFNNWRLVVSDDGSTDRTLSILADFQTAYGENRVQILHGPRNGFAQNFLSLIRRAPDAAYYAFSDQDDIWLNHHLNVSISYHHNNQINVPMVTSARTLLIDRTDQVFGASPIFRRTPSFQNALLQNIGGGNTMVLNQPARNLLAKVSANDQVVSHDWLAYLLVTAVGGRFVYIENPTLYYRQHAANLVGMNISMRARMTRCFELFRGRLRGWIERNLAVLDRFEDEFTPENREVYTSFKTARLQSGIWQRAMALRFSGVHRQSKMEDIAIFLAAMSGRI